MLSNLASGTFEGRIYPVNPKRSTAFGMRAWPTIGEVPDTVDLAVIAVSAPEVPSIVRQCVQKGVQAAIIISAGFREIGERGRVLEEQISEEARRGKLRILGPNCIGLMSPYAGLNATFATSMARPGNVAFLSQSGAICTAVLDWSFRNNLGFSAFVSTGSMLDVGWGDLIDYLGNDPKTKAILLYIESIDDTRAFVSAAREVALSKPIIAVKAGRTEAASHAAASHTGAMTGSDAVLDAAFHRCGVMRVNRISDLFYMADLLSKQPRPRGPKLTILTNAGGPGVLAADSLILNGGTLPELSKETKAKLTALLPDHWSHANPVDILGDATAERYEKALDILAQEPSSDGTLVIMAPQAGASASSVAERLKDFRKLPGKPLLASFMGGTSAEQAAQIIEQSSIPNFPYPDTAARAFAVMWQYASHLKSLYETPMASKRPAADIEAAAVVIEQVRAAGRTLLTEAESKELLEAHGIRTAKAVVVRTADEAAEAAERVGYPIVLKLHSTTVTHKSDVGGVKLGLRTEAGLRLAYAELTRVAGFEGAVVEPMVSHTNSYELIVGASYDPQFGPVVIVGSGGELVEVYEDRALGLPPLNTTLARRLLEDTKIFRALEGVRGRPPCDLAALEDALVRFSSLVLVHPEIAEIDVNPLLVGPDGVIALDARMVLFPPGVPAPRPAIRPYPIEYMWEVNDAVVRPIRPEDEPMMIRFHQTLSDQTVYFRYFAMIRLSQRISHERLSRICFVDYDREIALVAVQEGEIVAVGRISRIRGTEECEFAVVVNDRFQKRGWGEIILTKLIAIARQEGYAAVVGDVLLENRGMQHLCRKVGFVLETKMEDGIVHAVYSIRTPSMR